MSELEELREKIEALRPENGFVRVWLVDVLKVIDSMLDPDVTIKRSDLSLLYEAAESAERRAFCISEDYRNMLDRVLNILDK